MASYNHTNLNQIKHSPDHVYFDMTARAYDSPNTDNEIPMVFNDQRDVPILNNCSEYYLSVVRFQVDTFADLLPVLVPQIQRNQANANLTTYTLTLEYEDAVGVITTAPAEPVIWVPQKANAPVPNAPSLNANGLQTFSDYYYCYNFSYWINLVNDTLVTAMNALIALVPALAGIEPPFMAWNDDQTATLYARESMFDTDVFPQVRIYFNRPMYSLFSSFPSLKYNISNPNRKYYQLLMKRYSGEKVIVLPNFGINALIWNKQEYSTISQFTPVGSVLFTTGTMPITSNQLSNTSVYIDGRQTQLTNTYNNFANIITDISSDELAYKPSLLYVPSSEYRLIDMNNDQPLTQVDVAVHWRDKLGVIRPFFLPPNSSCSIKLMFRKKHLKF
jgi:hypothetical protein